MPRKRVDLTGQRFGLLVVLERTKDNISPKGQHVTMYKCLCDCGRTTLVSHGRLTSEITKSCGCLAGRPGGKIPKKKQGKPKPKAKKKPKANAPVPEMVETTADDLRPQGIQNFIYAFTRSCANDILKSPPGSETRKNTEELLQTEYFERITGIDGKALLARLLEEADKRQQKKRRKKA